MKMLTVLGTRPEIIRLSRVIAKLDTLCEHRVLHTGQNYDPNLSEVFFREMGVRLPDQVLDTRSNSAASQIASILVGCETVLSEFRPDRVLILGDTNSGLCSIVAKRMRIPVFHMEAGNRCYDDRVPEEVNRRIIDHSSDILMPYTEGSRRNLEREGIAPDRIFVTGNPIFEVLEHYKDHVTESEILASLGVSPRGYILVTLHRAENVDVPERLQEFVKAFEALAQKYDMPVLVSTHPRTRAKLQLHGVATLCKNVIFCEAFGLFDFIKLEQNARCVMSDSGTVQEECSIFNIPNVTLRDVTERPETIECGSNILSGATFEGIDRAFTIATKLSDDWQPPVEYMAPNVSDTVARIVLGYHHSLLR